MHGLGNDYVFVDACQVPVDRPAELARSVADRHFGIGSDGLILITPSREADVGMRIFNADGSEAEMCGNGLRCAAKYAYDHGLCRRRQMRVETGAGVLTVDLQTEGDCAVAATVNMGRPRLLRGQVPMTGPAEERVIAEPLQVDGRSLRVTCLSMGNPHCIVPLDAVDGFPWRRLGALMERHPAFPERVNVHFVAPLSHQEFRMVTWERGSGPTLACGTGASAACVALHLLDQTGRVARAHLPGGDLELEWREADDCVYMTGPATEVFAGQWPG
jgi:diaminopimelate epimerase